MAEDCGHRIRTQLLFPIFSSIVQIAFHRSVTAHSNKTLRNELTIIGTENMITNNCSCVNIIYNLILISSSAYRKIYILKVHIKS
jgi:hypothetical protein